MNGEKLYSFIAPLTVIGIMSYNIGGFLVGVYAVSSDTILHCNCIDKEINESMGMLPKYTPDNL